MDVCGHVSVRSQTITIVNDSSALSLGDKSLAKVYGRYRSRIDQSGDEVCLHPSDECGIFGAPDYTCGEAEDGEFDDYQYFLLGLDTTRSLDLGATEKECLCPDMDSSCDRRTDTTMSDMMLYRTQQVNAASAENCMTMATRPGFVNDGSMSTDVVTCPPTNVGRLLQGNRNGNANGNGNGGNGNGNNNGVSRPGFLVYNLGDIRQHHTLTSTSVLTLGRKQRQQWWRGGANNLYRNNALWYKRSLQHVLDQCFGSSRDHLQGLCPPYQHCSDQCPSVSRGFRPR